MQPGCRRKGYRRPTVFASRHHQFMELSKTRIMMVAPFMRSGVALCVALRALYHSKALPRARMAKITVVFRRLARDTRPFSRAPALFLV